MTLIYTSLALLALAATVWAVRTFAELTRDNPGSESLRDSATGLDGRTDWDAIRRTRQ